MASRKIAWVVGVSLALGGAPSAHAQQEVIDSLSARLRRAEAMIETLQRQVGDVAEAGVQTRSRARLELSGRVVVNAFVNTRRVNNVDNPQVVLPDPPGSDSLRGMGMAARQTRLGAVLSGVNALGGSFVGDLDVDFYGGQVPSGGGRHFPLLRLRTARGIVRWSQTELLVGQESPLISGLNPVSPAAVGTPEFAAAGNLWLWLPQTRFAFTSTGSVRFGFAGAVLAPTSGDPALAFDTDNDLAERSKRPFVQARVHVAWGEDERGEIGCGIHNGALVAATRRVESRALACDALVPVATWLEIRGEYFTGQALRGLGGGGIGQNFGAGNVALETSGGWGQINARLGGDDVLRGGVGCGADHPKALATRRRNDACSVYAIMQPSGPLFMGAEVRRIRTAFAGTQYINDHVTLALGYEF